jgi:diguanylate cyclase (GGDEF)-like protein
MNSGPQFDLVTTQVADSDAPLVPYSQAAAADSSNTVVELLRLRAALNEIDDGIILLDSDLRLEFINRAAREFSGSPKTPAPGPKLPYAELIRGSRVATDKEELEDFIARRLKTVAAGDPAPVEVRFTSGRIARARCIALADGGRLLTYTDITDIVRRNEELEQLHAALDQVDYGVILLDHAFRARYINRAFRSMANIPDAMTQSQPTFEQILVHGRAQNAFAVPNDQVDYYIEQRLEQIRKGNSGPIELRWADGRVIRHQITSLRGGSRMLTYTDITDLARTTEKLEKLAATDGLTGLVNRRQFIALAESELARFRRYRRPMSMLLLDIDDFKSVNDRFGHDVGDRMIMHIAMLCDENKRDADVVARVGGEEFAVLLPETSLDDSCAVGERLRRLVAARPLEDGGRNIPVTVSVGVAEFEASMTGVSDLMKLADRMLYQAKRAGRNRTASVEEKRDIPGPISPALDPLSGG